MKTKTAQNIEDDVYLIVKKKLSLETGSSWYKGEVQHHIYKNRINDRQRVFGVVKFVSGGSADAGDVQTAVVVVNIFVPKLIGDTGRYEKDIAMCREYEYQALTFVNQLTASATDYRFELAQTISTDEDREINCNFVTIRLRVSYFDR